MIFYYVMFYYGSDKTKARTTEMRMFCTMCGVVRWDGKEVWISEVGELLKAQQKQ